MHAPLNPAHRPLSLGGMRALAGGLLVLMAALFITAHLLADAHPVWPYIGAFSEAALVGGLADWFAVTALFRRPFGLPIPHTAIIPRSKERIARALADFIAENFLAPDNVAVRLAETDLAGGLARAIAQPAEADRLAAEIARLAPGVLDAFDDVAIADFARRQVTAFTADGRVAPSLGALLKVLTEQNRHQAVLDLGVEEAWRALVENEAAIRQNVRDKTALVWRLVGVDNRIADGLIKAVQQTLQEMAADPRHPVRLKLTEILERLADDLRTSPELRAKIERAAKEVIAQPVVASYLGEIWTALKSGLLRDATREDGALRGVLADALLRAGRGLGEDHAAREAVNQRLRLMARELSARYGRDISNLVGETIRSWDSATVVEKLEQNVGRDLQYVRINGTLIGGLIGLTIHQVSVMLG